MKKALRFLLVAVLIISFVLPIQFASATSDKISTTLANAMETTDTVLPVSIRGTNYIDNGEIVQLAHDIYIGPMWDYNGTIEEWWQEYETVAKEKTAEKFATIFEECGISYSSVEYDAYNGAHLLTVTQINALANHDSITSLGIALVENLTVTERTYIPNYTAEHALRYLQKVVGIIANPYWTYGDDYNRDEQFNSADALFLLQCSVGKRNRGAYPIGLAFPE